MIVGSAHWRVGFFLRSLFLSTWFVCGMVSLKHLFNEQRQTSFPRILIRFIPLQSHASFLPVSRPPTSSCTYPQSLPCPFTLLTINSNRSAAYAALSQWEDSLRDARQCIKLDRTFVKGHWRAGNALMQMEMWNQAKAAFDVGM